MSEQFFSCYEDGEPMEDNRFSAIEYYLDGFAGKPTPCTIALHGFVLETINPNKVEVLTDLLDILDEHFGYPDESTEPTDKMLEAERKFVRTIVDEYDVWTCKRVSTEIIDTKEWITKNRPDWLPEVTFEERVRLEEPHE